nr:hypothetical protein [Saprospiraceae bacterium]
MVLNDVGKMVEREWLKLPQRYGNIALHEFVVMPNHFHSILQITAGASIGVAQNEENVQNEVVTKNNGPVKNDHGMDVKGQPQGIAPAGIAPSGKGKTVGDMIGAFQSIVTVQYIRRVKNMDWQLFNGKLWQRNYYDHIIRNEQSYHRISEYIKNNPANWQNDKLHQKQ